MKEVDKSNLPTNLIEKHKWKRLIIILEAAQLQTIQTKKGIELLSSDDHSKEINKIGKKLEDYRPDIVHHVK